MVNVSYGAYSAIALTVWFGLRSLLRRHSFNAMDLLVILLVLIVFVSPMWVWSPVSSPQAVSSSLGAAASVLYVLPVRWVVRERQDFLRFARIISWITSAYSAYFLLNASNLVGAGDIVTDRMSVEFANANYTAAVISFGAVATLWLVCATDSGVRFRVLYVLAAILQFATVLQTGSRAAFAGMLVAILVILALRRFARIIHGLTLILMVFGFVIGFFPTAATTLFRALAEPLGATGAFGRDAAAIATASGRSELWEVSREIAAGSWLVGWGPGRYQLQEGPYFLPAHAWGLEYVASVGILGTALIAFIVVRFYFGRDGRPWHALRGNGALWNATTSIALVPSLMLSTHQWTLWAWVAIALWARASVLEQSASGELPESRPRFGRY
ncbi:MAG: O-antigen ligase family protein [Agromyces sp.]